MTEPSSFDPVTQGDLRYAMSRFELRMIQWIGLGAGVPFLVNILFLLIVAGKKTGCN